LEEVLVELGDIILEVILPLHFDSLVIQREDKFLMMLATCNHLKVPRAGIPQKDVSDFSTLVELEFFFSQKLDQAIACDF